MFNALGFSYYRVNAVPAFWCYLETLPYVRAQAVLTLIFMKQGFWASNLVSQLFYLLWATLEIAQLLKIRSSAELSSSRGNTRRGYSVRERCRNAQRA